MSKDRFYLESILREIREEDRLIRVYGDLEILRLREDYEDACEMWHYCYEKAYWSDALGVFELEQRELLDRETYWWNRMHELEFALRALEN